jgi:hypothetical protein
MNALSKAKEIMTLNRRELITMRMIEPKFPGQHLTATKSRKYHHSGDISCNSKTDNNLENNTEQRMARGKADSRITNPIFSDLLRGSTFPLRKKFVSHKFVYFTVQSIEPANGNSSPITSKLPGREVPTSSKKNIKSDHSLVDTND